MKQMIFTLAILFASSTFANSDRPIQDFEFLAFFGSQISACTKLTEKDRIEIAKQGASCIVIANNSSRGLRLLAPSTSGNCAKIDVKKYLTTLAKNRCKQLEQSFLQPTEQQNAAAQAAGFTDNDFLSYFNTGINGCSELKDLDKIQIVKSYSHCLKIESAISSRKISVSAECGGNNSIFEPAVNSKCETRKYDKAYVNFSDYPPVAVVDASSAKKQDGAAATGQAGGNSSCGAVPGPHTCESWAAALAAKPTYSMCRIGYSGNMAMMCHFDENYEQPQGICDDTKVGNSVNYGGVILTCMPSGGANYSEIWTKEYNENKTADIKSLKEVIPKPKRWYGWITLKKVGEWESCVSTPFATDSCNRETIGTLKENGCHEMKCVRLNSETKNRQNIHWSNEKDYIAADTKEADDAYSAKVDGDWESKQFAADATEISRDLAADKAKGQSTGQQTGGGQADRQPSGRHGDREH